MGEENPPQSALRQQMEYYIEPAEQTPEVQEQLKAITPTSLNPEELTFLDPACGSGHILVEAYDLFKAIYQERGYRAKDIPSLILQKNLFGLEIDDRAAQLAAFALMMKARADDRRIFDSEAKPNVVAIQDSKGLNAEDITHALNSPINKEDVPKEYLFEEIQEEKDGLFSKKALAEKGHVSQADIAYLLELFENAKTFGSLIQIPPKLAAKLPEIEKRVDDVLKFGDLTHASAHVLKPLLQQARLLSRHYDSVVANPPYMGPKSMPQLLRDFARDKFERCKPDVYAMFIERNVSLAGERGYVGMVTMHNWMFLASFEDFRKHLLSANSVETLAHLGPRAFEAISGEVVNTVAFSIRPFLVPNIRAFFQRVTDLDATEKKAALKNRTRQLLGPFQHSFDTIPGSPVAYWVSDTLRTAFSRSTLVDSTISDGQNITANNQKFVRCWWEVSLDNLGRSKKWLLYAKGGDFRRWYGNLEFAVDWSPEAPSVLSQ